MKGAWCALLCVAACITATQHVSAQVRFDPEAGAVGEADQARNWDQKPGVEDEDVALFVPRVILVLPRLVLSVVFWLPEQGMVLVDRYHLSERAERLLYFDEAHHFGWTPLLAYQSGYGPTAGAKVFHKSLFGHGEEFDISGVYGGRYTQAYRLALYADRAFGSRLWLDTQARFESEPGLLFGGIGIVENDGASPGEQVGPRESNELTYLGQDRVLGLLRLGYTAGEGRRLVKFGGTAIFNHRKFEPNSVDKTPLASVYDPAQVPGLTEHVNTIELQANLLVDLREHHGLDPRGLFFETFIGGVPDIDRYEYLHYGFELAYTIDLYRATRLLRLRVALEAVEGDDDGIPFTDLPRLGGSNRLRGYVEAQFRDKRAVLASAEYQYPVHESLHAHLFVDAGYVAQHYSDLFELDRWKVGFGGGLLLGNPDEITFRFDIAYGDGVKVYLSTDIAQAFAGRSDQL